MIIVGYINSEIRVWIGNSSLPSFTNIGSTWYSGGNNVSKTRVILIDTCGPQIKHYLINLHAQYYNVILLFHINISPGKRVFLRFLLQHGYLYWEKAQYVAGTAWVAIYFYQDEYSSQIWAFVCSFFTTSLSLPNDQIRGNASVSINRFVRD